MIPVSFPPSEIGVRVAAKPQAAVRLHWEQVSYGEWIIVFRRLRLEAPVKCIGYALATHADWATGHDAFPGIQTLALETGYRSHHTIVDALKVLREMKLVDRKSSGSKSGRRGNADSYHLTLTNPLRVAADVEPCECKPKQDAKPADPWAALPDHVHHVHMVRLGRSRADRRQNECRSMADHLHLVHMVHGRTHARGADQVRTNPST